MIAFFERLKAIGWAYGEKLTSTQQSAIDSRQQKLMSDQVDDWLQNWTSISFVTDRDAPVRLASGVTIAPGMAAVPNTFIFMTDVRRVETVKTVVPSVGAWYATNCCGYGTNAMLLGQNSTDYTKAVFSLDKANLLNMTERTVAGLVAGDLAGNAYWCVTDPTDGYFYIFSGVAARKVWSSPTAATWTARTAATGVSALFAIFSTGRPVVANNGHLITFGDNGASIGQFSYSSDHGVTWTTTTIASSEPIVRMDWSPTRGLWVVVGKFGRVWTSATPGGAFTLQNTAFSTVAAANRITFAVVADGVIAAVYDNVDGGANQPGCLLLYSIDLGATWKSVAIDEAENANSWILNFDNQALWLRFSSTNYRTKALGNPMNVANGTIGS